MKSTGMTRKIDPLGRMVIPVELRRTLGINQDDYLEIYTDHDRIILRKYQPASECVFCSHTDELISHKGKMVCTDCLEAMSNGVA